MDSSTITSETGAGFYKLDPGGDWFFASKSVHAPSYTLLIENKDEYTYPVHGWNYFESPPQEYIDWGLSLLT